MPNWCSAADPLNQLALYQPIPNATCHSDRIPTPIHVFRVNDNDTPFFAGERGYIWGYGTESNFLDVVWEYHAYPTTRTLYNFIAFMRLMLEYDPADLTFMLNVRGLG